MNQIVQNGKPTISIGMPVYNGERYIREALDSLLGQSFENFELIISDNASNDSTQSICLQYAESDARIKYFRQVSNMGAAANFKFVLEQAVGTYFMWAAYDDKWSSKWLERTLSVVREPGVIMAFAQVIHIDDAGREMKHPANGVNFAYAYSASPLRRRLRFYLAYEGMGKANSIYSLYEQSVVKPLDGMWSEIIGGARFYDYSVVYECLKYGKIKQVEGATLFKRIHGESEGANPKRKVSMMTRCGRLLWPFPPRLIAEYLKFSSMLEKAILIMLIPFKLLAAYRFRLVHMIARCRDI